MAEISAGAVKALRDKTGMPMMDCKTALSEAGGDEKKAISILKEKSGKVMLKRAENATSEGKIFALVAKDGSKGAMVEVQCESPPVADAVDFVAFGKALVTQLLEGPGATIAEALLSQPAPDKSGKTLKDILDDLIGRIREKIVVARVARVEGPVAAYVHHDGKNAALFQATGEKTTADVLRDVAMHIVAMRPTVVNVEDLNPADVQAERDRLTKEAKASGKPDNVIDKIVDGRLKTYYKDEAGVLVAQGFAKDQTKTVSQALAEQGLKAKAFTRWVLGAN